MSKRDIKVGSIPAYYRNLASSLPLNIENRDKLVEAYLKYANMVEKEAEKLLVKFKRKSYAKRNK